jgi:hypothetical protein
LPAAPPPPPPAASTSAAKAESWGKRGTINGREFLLALKDAGKVLVQGRGILLDDKKRVEDEKKAIADYVGYSTGSPHGNQLENARRRALRESKGLTNNENSTPPYTRGATRATARGYVAGCYDALAKAASSAVAEEQKEAGLLIALSKIERQMPLNRDEREFFSCLSEDEAFPLLRRSFFLRCSKNDYIVGDADTASNLAAIQLEKLAHIRKGFSF